MKRLLSALALSASACLPISAQATTQSFTLAPGPSMGSGSVQYIDFDMLSTASIEIQAFGSSTQGSGFNRDPQIILFRKDAALDLSDYIDSDDDGGVGLDSYLSRTLNAGSYRLAVSEFYFGQSDAIAGINHLDMPFTRMLVTLNSSALGAASVVPSVPEPGTYALTLTCIACMAMLAARHRPRATPPTAALA